MAGKARQPGSGMLNDFANALLTILTFVLATPVHAEQSQIGEALSARGLLSAPMRVELRTLLQAPILELPFSPGDRFERDDLLVSFDCARYDAEEKAAKAAADAAWIEYNSKKRLLRHGAIGKDEVSLAAARASQATAQAQINAVATADCNILAPFSGRVALVNARPFEYPGNSEPLMSIIDESSLEVELIVPSNWLAWLEKGARFSFKVEETGASLAGTVQRLSPEIDPVSQTIRIFGLLQSVAENNLLPGMSGVAIFEGKADG